MLAHAAAHRGQGTAFANHVVGFLDLALGQQRDVALHVHAGRTRRLARGAPRGLGNSVDVGNGLRIGTEDCLARAQRAIELAGQRHRASDGTLAAGVALLEVHVARPLADLDLEMPWLAADLLDVGQGDDLDVLVARGLDQFGRKRTHGAVASGEGLVELGHPAADGGRGFQQIDLEAGVGQVE